MRRLAALYLSFVAIAVAGCSPGGAPEAARSEPAGLPALLAPGAAEGASVVLITLDTTRADRLGCYGAGGAETPNLDRLAAHGVRFVDAVSPVPMTLPAHASVMTGLDPPHHGVRVNGEAALAPERRTLAEALAGAGYRTAAFVSSFVLDPRFGLDQGFETYDATLEATTTAAFEPQTERRAESTTNAALGWLSRLDGAPTGAGAGKRTPFFLWVHYFDAHDPYAPPEPFASRFRERPYEGEIAYIDHELGRLVAALPAGTLVVVAGDHGESLGEHGERYHSRTVYEGAVHVPLIVARVGGDGAGVTDGAAGTVIDGFVVSLVDLFPTVLDLVGLLDAPDPQAGELDGRSLASGKDQGELAGRSVYLETLNPWYDNGWAPLHAARGHAWKYVRAPRPELYDLARDPEESENLLAAGDEPGGGAASRLAELRAFVDRRAPAGGDDLAGLAGAGGEEGADPEVRRRLEALGYLTPGGRSEGSTTVDPAELPDPKDMLPLLDDLAEGRRALGGGRPAEAERSARRILALAPRDRSALQLLAESYATRGRAGEAERALRASLDVGPTIGACVLLAQVVMQGGRLDEAEVLLDRAAEIDPRHGAVILARGDLALVRGRPDEAVAHYREAATADPYRFAGLAEARILRVEAIHRRGD